MRASALGRLLLAAGGIVIVLGAFFPEALVFIGRWTSPGTSHPAPDRSHWVVVGEDLDMLLDPDPDLDAWNFDFYRAEAAGLLFLPAAGALLALSALFARSRAAAAAFGGLHTVMYVGLAWLASRVWVEAPEGSGGAAGLKHKVLWASIVMSALAVGEAVVMWRTLSKSRRGRLLAVDRAGLIPAVVLLLAGGGLYAAFRGHPNWPADGYAVIAGGALLAILGMRLRREPREPVN